MRSIYFALLDQIHRGSRSVLATVVRTSGSTPQKPGSSALFGEEGLLAGTVGGGMLEGKVQHISKNLMISESSDHFYFNLDSDQGEDGSICGGEAEVLIDANPAFHVKALEAMAASLAARKQGFLLTVVSKKNEHGRAIRRYWISGLDHEKLPSRLDSPLRDAIPGQIKETIRHGLTEVKFQSTATGRADMAFLEFLRPMLHLVIAGAGHVGKALAHIGSLLEFEVTVIDDRPEFANPESIPDADHLVVNEIGAAIKKVNAGRDTYIVIVTRGHLCDTEALKSCIGSDATYIGMIGSTNKVGIMKKQFLENNWATPEQWSRVYTPIGLSIGSKTVQEIAISIAAQLVDVRNSKIASYAE